MENTYFNFRINMFPVVPGCRILGERSGGWFHLSYFRWECHFEFYPKEYVVKHPQINDSDSWKLVPSKYMFKYYVPTSLYSSRAVHEYKF